MSVFKYDRARDQWSDGVTTISAESMARTATSVDGTWTSPPAVAPGTIRIATPRVKDSTPLTVPRSPRRPPQRPAVAPSTPSQSRYHGISHERDSSGLSRVRLGRVRESKGVVDGHVMIVVTTQYLDGHARAVADSGNFHDETESPFDPTPTWGEDVANFGRLSKAMSSFVVSMSLPDGEEVSPEQVAIFIAGYGNLQSWCRRVAEQMSQAEGEMEVVETMLRRML